MYDHKQIFHRNNNLQPSSYHTASDTYCITNINKIVINKNNNNIEDGICLTNPQDYFEFKTEPQTLKSDWIHLNVGLVHLFCVQIFARRGQDYVEINPKTHSYVKVNKKIMETYFFCRRRW